MRSEVTVSFGPEAPVRIDLDEVQPMPHDVARWWLDEQFTRMGCEPLRPTGKVLLADKVLCVAQAAGPKQFGDARWASEFARASSAALAKPVVRIDVPGLTVSY
ncbi:hypothetical protein [Variovorax terrae]|uniref:Uncharacterized protein n=1 Tax=Variovorax terrae TaxID=2923278 RepID=A0A9X2APG3_9BURK|nr:hypothetical protein [Variovorax terrae]MCJ0762006.1 hypothetical protein [Variovorax terrae]